MLIYPPDEWSKAKAFHREQQCVGGSTAAVLTTQLDKSFYALAIQFPKKRMIPVLLKTVIGFYSYYMGI
jgi:hypothetical protein